MNTIQEAVKTNGKPPVTEVKPTEVAPKDEYGRDAAERTIELTPRVAEAVNTEVKDGRWQTYNDALTYVLQRGFAEIKRQRDAARALASAKLIKLKTDNYKSMINTNPALATNVEFVKTMLADLGIKM